MHLWVKRNVGRGTLAKIPFVLYRLLYRLTALDEGGFLMPDREVLPKKAQEDLTEIERAEQRAAYGKRMEKMNRRLSKYALDPDNKKMYRGRADQWSEYTENGSRITKNSLQMLRKVV